MSHSQPPAAPRATRAAVLAAALLLALVGGSARAQASDPFAAGLRWSRGASPTAPWIPRAVAFAGAGELVLAGEALGQPAFALLGGSDAATHTVLAHDPLPGAQGVVDVAAGDRADELYCLRQLPDAGGLRTEVARYDPFLAATSGAPAATPRWVRGFLPAGDGGARLALDDAGSALLVARVDAAGVLQLARLDPTDGSDLATAALAGADLRALRVADGGARALVVTSATAHVVDGALASLHAEPLAASTAAVDLSADGERVALGGIGSVRLLGAGPAGWAPVAQVAVGPEWMATHLALSADGATLAVGWWNHQDGASIRFDLWDISAAPQLVVRVDQPALAGGLQNFPSAVDLTRDGARALFAAWGNGGADRQLQLVDRALGATVWSTYLPGSALAAALDPSGTRMAVAVKGSHANQFATTGMVRLYDTGERDLVTVGLTSPGGGYHFAARRAGASLAVFALGAPLAPPVPLAGIGGLLGIDPARPYHLQAAPADAAGRADVQGPIPGSTALVGIEVAVQALFASAGGLDLSTTRARPVVL